MFKMLFVVFTVLLTIHTVAFGQRTTGNVYPAASPAASETCMTRQDQRKMSTLLQNLEQQLQQLNVKVTALAEEFSATSGNYSKQIHDLKDYVKLKLVTTCPYGYMNYGESCYKLHNQGQDWHTANNTCHEKGGYLAIITSESEQDFLADLIKDISPDNNVFVFVGAHDQGTEGVWVWEATGEQVTLSDTAYTHWYPGEPNNYGENEHCMTIWPEKGFQWNDILCSMEKRFICETGKSNN